MKDEMIDIQYWSSGRKLLLRFFVLFVGLFICSFSFPHTLIPDVGRFFTPVFEKLAVFCGDHIFHLKRPYTQRIISDSTGMYLDVFVVFVLSVVLSMGWRVVDRKEHSYDKLLYWFIVVVRYYLAMQLLHYGFNKLFKWQFYLPEPNTMFTTVGNTTPDLLYWSVMGISRPYTMFSGLLEVVAAVMLLWRKTSFAGALLAFAVMVNVVVINFSYDISVKVYSLFLMLLSMIVVAPEWERLLNVVGVKAKGNSIIHAKRWTGMAYVVIKLVVIVLLVTDNIYPYAKARDFNHDKAAKPLLYGAYAVKTFVKNGDTLVPLLTDSYRWKMVFVHSRGYFITQGMNDEMKDYRLAYDTANRKLQLEEYRAKEPIVMSYTSIDDSVLILSGNLKGDSIWVQTQKIELQTLPVMQNDFNWTIDN